ncbi:acyltransferase [Solitalea lacus]|nr:acyltransferase [Solitalea lacus]UKJ07069.1 acyltransferase [Solitalea lacus]
MKKKISLIFYYFIANRLPSSFFPLGPSFNKLRVGLAKNFLTIGDNCKIQPRVNLGDGNGISIGSHCMINENVYIQGATIGNYVMIAPNVAIYSNTHKFDRTDIPMALQGKTIEIPCEIEDDVWIGRNVVIMPGLKIGKGSIIGAGAFVAKDVEPYSIVGGVPAKLIRKRK